MKIELEHVAIGGVWRVTIESRSLEGEVHIRLVNDFEVRYQVRWCRGCPEHLEPALNLIFCGEHPQEAATLAEVNARLRELMDVAEFN